ncbi:MAG TPA: glutamyl-tRNA reductase [Elusimicrobia bacterium]|nr:glutamyl-tRNA reductase [Elusimicrobiota bacterium]
MNAENLFVVGLSYIEAPPAAREKAAVSPAQLTEALAELKEQAALDEVVLVSTCSRVEVVGAARDPRAAAEAVRSWFSWRAGAETAALLRMKLGREAARHLFRVACGLDSWIIGECEILGQTRQAYQAAHALRRTGRALNRLFQSAVAAGKAVRAETGLQNGIHSIGGAAALLVSRIFRSGAKGRTLVVGAGQAAEAVVKHLAAKDFKRILVANRTLERAQALAQALGGEAVTFEAGLESLESVEVAVFSSSCREPLLRAAELARIVQGRERPLFLIDLGLPRNVEAACAEIPGVYLYDLSHLEGVVKDIMERKAADKSAAESLCEEAANECVRELGKTAFDGVHRRPRRKAQAVSIQGMTLIGESA